MAGCSSKMDFLSYNAHVDALSGLDLEDGGGQTDIEEKFFCRPIALQVFNRKEAGVLRRTLERPLSVSSDISDGEDINKKIQKWYNCILSLGYTNIFDVQQDESEVSRQNSRRKIKKVKVT